MRCTIGLGPLGEHLLYKHKTEAYSLYDTNQEGVGCPHSSCLRGTNVTLHRVFWSCLAAATLHHVFTHRWQTLRLKKIFFASELCTVPPHIWDLVGMSFPLGTPTAQDKRTEAVPRVADCCWNIGAVMDLHGVWRWRIAYIGERNDVSMTHHKALHKPRLWHSYNKVYMHLTARPDIAVAQQVNRV